jgi:hypothetical protein
MRFEEQMGVPIDNLLDRAAKRSNSHELIRLRVTLTLLSIRAI